MKVTIYIHINIIYTYTVYNSGAHITTVRKSHTSDSYRLMTKQSFFSCHDLSNHSYLSIKQNYYASSKRITQPFDKSRVFNQQLAPIYLQYWERSTCIQNRQLSRFGAKTAGILTQICLMDLSILINWISPFPIWGVSGVLFHFYSISNRYSC